MEIHDKKQLAAICIERLKKEYPLSDCTLDYEHAWWKCALLHSAPMPA